MYAKQLDKEVRGNKAKLLVTVTRTGVARVKDLILGEKSWTQMIKGWHDKKNINR